MNQTCPKCKKSGPIQATFPLGNGFINEVLRCGHLRLIKEQDAWLDPKNSGTGNAENNSLESPTVINSEPSFPVSEPATQEPISAMPEPIKYKPCTHIDAWINWLGLKQSLIPKPKEIDASYKSVDLTKTAREYQIQGVEWAERNGIKVLIADAMGVGKTIQGLITIKRNRSKVTPCLVLVKGATLFQWSHEYHTWNNGQFGSMIPVIKRTHLIPGFEFYILSMDMLPREGILDLLLQLGIKCLIIDECQNFKDPNAARTEILIKFIKLAKIPYIIALSGTPIKNKFAEYKTIVCDVLQKMSDAEFSSYLTYNEKGYKVKLNPFYVNRWQERTKDFILRRERHEVLPDLPALTKDYQIMEITDPNIRNTYNRTLDLFKNWLRDNKSGVTSQNVIGWLSQIRAITGQAKCKWAIEWTRDFLESTDEQLAIGIEHTSVRDTLYLIFDQFGLRPLKLSGEDDMYRKADVVRRFTNGDNRLLVINIVAGGVGLNLQTCPNLLELERPWSPADEDQLIARFHRMGQLKGVTATIPIAKGTIDEFSHELLFNKQGDLANAGIGEAEDESNKLDTLIEFAEKVIGSKI